MFLLFDPELALIFLGVPDTNLIKNSFILFKFFRAKISRMLTFQVASGTEPLRRALERAHAAYQNQNGQVLQCVAQVNRMQDQVSQVVDKTTESLQVENMQIQSINFFGF